MSNKEKEENTKAINYRSRAYISFKRLLDIFLSILSLVFVLPIVFFFAICIVIESPGNPFYLQKRMGLLGKEFTLFKLRSMRLNAEVDGAKWAEENDPRVTKVGRFIRRTRIDELPQLLNVLFGDMALIGPRPERKIFVERFSFEIPDFPKRMDVKPGLTGWAQVNGGYDITPEQKLKLDLYYIDNMSIKLDLNIIGKTVMILFSGEGAR